MHFGDVLDATHERGSTHAVTSVHRSGAVDVSGVGSMWETLK